jgi:hypothetical protein
MVHTQRIHPKPLDLQLIYLSPKEEAYTFPIIYDSGNLSIIFNNKYGLVKPFTSTTDQHIFKTQACIPMMQLMKQINGHALTIPANSGANLTLSTSLLMTLTLSSQHGKK